MVKGRREGAEGRVAVGHLDEDEGGPGGVDVDAVADHGARVNGVAEAGAGPHFGAVEGPGGGGDEAEPGGAGEAVVGAAPAPEEGEGDRDGDGGGDGVAEGEEGLQVRRVHATRAAAALAGPDEVVELARFGAFVGFCFGGGGGGGVGWWWGGAGEGAFEGGELGFGGAEGGGEVREAGEEVGVGLELRGVGVCCGAGLGKRGRRCRGEEGGEVFIVDDEFLEGLDGGVTEVEGGVFFGFGVWRDPLGFVFWFRGSSVVDDLL